MATVLIVDDQPDIRRPIGRLLQMEGYSVVAVANTIAAMAAAKREPVDLILLDVMIPPMDGLTFLSLLRDDPELRDIPVIVLSALSDPTTMSRARELSVREFLVKNQFTSDELVEAVRKYAPAHS